MQKMYSIPINWKAKSVDKVMLVGLSILAATQLCLLFVGNLIKTQEVVNWDSSMALWHGIEMWKKHSIFLDGLYYGTTLEIDTPAFLFLPVFFLTNHLGLALAVGFAVLYVVELLICCDIFQNLGKGRLPGILAVILLYTPYAVSELDWAKMLFMVGGQYSFRILLLLLSIDMLVVWEHTENRKKGVVLTVCCAAVAFWTSLSCGSYALLVVLLPLLLWLIFKGLNKAGFRFVLRQWIAFCLVFPAAVVGWRLHIAFAGDVASSANNVITASEFWPNLGAGITGWLMLFGGLTDDAVFPVFSTAGILLIVRCVFPLLCLTLVLFNMIRRKRVTVLGGMFMCIALVNIAVLIFTHTIYGAAIFEYRYHIVWSVMLLICVAELWDEFRESWYRTIFAAGILLVMMALNASGYKNILTEPDEAKLAREVIDTAHELGCDTVYWYGEPLYPRQTRALSPDLYSADIRYNAWSYSVLNTNIYYDYTDRSSAGDKNILVLRECDAGAILALFPRYEFIKPISEEWGVYYCEQNPWDGVSGLPRADRTTIDFPRSTGYWYTGGLVDDGAVMKAEAGDCLWGPDTPGYAGVYDIEISYEMLGSALPEAAVVIAVDEQNLVCETLTGSDGRFIIKNVAVPEGEHFNIRVTAVKGDWIFNSISYTFVSKR